MNIPSLLHIIASATTILVCILVLAFSTVAYRRLHLRALAFLIGASVIRFILEVAARLHSALSPSHPIYYWPFHDYATFYALYLVCYTITVILWGLGIILLIRYSLAKRGMPPNTALEPTPTAP